MLAATAGLIMAAACLAQADEAGMPLRVQDGRFVDAAGRQVLLHGINVGNKGTPYVSAHTEADYARLRTWGFNCIRLLVLWAGLEPEEGRYDEAYLQRLDERIAWARRHGIHVILDFHQDLYGEGVPGGDGAPKWACLNDGLPHYKPQSGPWSVAYYTSPMVHRVFDNFWANKPLPSGVGVQDRFALAWQHVARRYANEPAVAGYDLLNEPFAGSLMLRAPGLILPPLIRAAIGDAHHPSPLTELWRLWHAPGGTSQMLQNLGNPDAYASIVDAAAPPFQQFEREKLMPMYQRVANAIRAVDPHHIIFIEPSVTANAGVRSALSVLTTLDGQRDPQQALAPHGYDIVVDTPLAASASNARLTLIFDRLRELSARLELPAVIGEWGGFYGSREALGVALMYKHEFEQGLFGDTYWDWHDDIANTAYYPALARPIPVAAAGQLKSCQTDYPARTFTCTWQESGTAPSIFYLPGAWYPNGYDIRIEPPGETSTPEPQYLHIPPTGTAERTLTVTPRP